jgi:hypothetical protein
MSDFLDDLGRQLVERARHDVAGRRRRNRRTLVLAFALLAVIAVPAAAVTGVFDRKPRPRHLSSSPGLVDLGDGCTQKNPPRGNVTTDPPDQALLDELAVLRRPQQPSDRVPESKLFLSTVDGVNPCYVRRVRSSDGFSGYLIPAKNVRFLSSMEACANHPAPPAIKAEAGVCIHAGRGATCATADAIKKGFSLLTSGSRRGGTFAAAIVPDGVEAVIWRVRRGTGFLDTKIPVRDNVVIGRFPSRAGHGLYIYWVDANGKKRLVRGPHHFTQAERRELARERALDRAAGPKPTISPAAGSAHTLFELRMRVANPKPGVIYAVTITGPMPGQCGRTWVQRIGMTPGGRGDDRGLMRAAFGRSKLEDGWCPGTYRGVVRKGRNGPAPVVGRFSFRVE